MINFIFSGACKMNLFSEMTTKQKENFCFAIFRSAVLTSGYMVSVISGDTLPVCGKVALLDFVEENNLSKDVDKKVVEKIFLVSW